MTVAALATVREAWDLMEGAAKYEEQMESLDALARQYGTTSNSVVDSVRQASNGLISMADAASISSK